MTHFFIFYFKHATWNGLFVADLVFPWFLWIMGVCIPISIKSQMSKNTSRSKIILTILYVSSIRLHDRNKAINFKDKFLTVFIRPVTEIHKAVFHWILFKLSKWIIRRSQNYGCASAFWNFLFRCGFDTRPTIYPSKRYFTKCMCCTASIISP